MYKKDTLRKIKYDLVDWMKTLNLRQKVRNIETRSVISYNLLDIFITPAI